MTCFLFCATAAPAAFSADSIQGGAMGFNLRRSVFNAFLAAGVLSAAAPDTGVDVWKASDLKARERGLATTMDAFRSSNVTLAEKGNQTYLLAHREGNGQAELHEHVADIIVINNGEVRLIYGGTIVNGKPTAEGEIRGDSISGGQSVDLRAGDIFHIAPKVPHQMLVKAQVNYFVAKVRE
jgi:mannose-6-phosphate isomerase-like protein (cupin superfamily)